MSSELMMRLMISWLKNIETKLLSRVKAGLNVPLFWFSKPALFATSGL